MLKLSAERIAFESARAAEIQRAEEALRRERILWSCAALASVFAGSAIGSIGFHVRSLSSGAVWIMAGVVIAEVGPLAILVIALHREQS